MVQALDTALRVQGTMPQAQGTTLRVQDTMPQAQDTMPQAQDTMLPTVSLEGAGAEVEEDSQVNTQFKLKSFFHSCYKIQTLLTITF